MKHYLFLCQNIRLVLLFRRFCRRTGVMSAGVMLIAVLLLHCVGASCQERKVENRPYTDLRVFHFGVVVGAHLQDLELVNVGPVTLTDADGNTYESVVTVDQDRWDPGFQVGVLGELRLSSHFALRLAPMMYFGTRHLTFHNHTNLTDAGLPTEVRQNLKSVYVGCVADVVFAAKRFNNHRPYVVAGVTPVLNLTSRDNDYLRLNKSDIFASVGVGCDFYLPFFKLRPELKFMYGLTNSFDKGHASRLKSPEMLPYAYSTDRTRSKMVCLSFYFE